MFQLVYLTKYTTHFGSTGWHEYTFHFNDPGWSKPTAARLAATGPSPRPRRRPRRHCRNSAARRRRRLRLGCLEKNYKHIYITIYINVIICICMCIYQCVYMYNFQLPSTFLGIVVEYDLRGCLVTSQEVFGSIGIYR